MRKARAAAAVGALRGDRLHMSAAVTKLKDLHRNRIGTLEFSGYCFVLDTWPWRNSTTSPSTMM